MAVIIGQSTAVTISNVSNGGIISIDWSNGSNTERLYSLGQGQGSCGPKEFAAVRDSQVQVSFSLYGGASTALSTCPPAGCADSPAFVLVSVNPGVCGTATAQGLSNQKVYITSYSYSKDRAGHGTEQWSGNAWVAATGGSGVFVKPIPTYVILGIAEGNTESDVGRNDTLVGVTFDDDSITDSYKGNVAASQISIGDYMIGVQGKVKTVGGSKFGLDNASYAGIKASASANLNTQPIYL